MDSGVTQMCVALRSRRGLLTIIRYEGRFGFLCTGAPRANPSIAIGRVVDGNVH